MVFGIGSKIPLLVMKMKFEWRYLGESPIKLRSFLKQQYVSRRLLAKIRHEGGQILVDGKEGRTVDKINKQQTVTLILPAEHGRKTDLVPSYVPIDVLYEDRDLLVVNKPPHLTSVPSQLYRDDSLVNRVCGYYAVRNYQGLIPHIVSRLDRDTSGLVLFAKHRYAHALLDVSMQQHEIHKQYLALATGRFAKQSEFDITTPIGRAPDSLFKRQVDVNGQEASTHFKCLKSGVLGSLLLVQPLTGRTHQIRVHCASIGHPLLGDTMYGGDLSTGLTRQALHCYQLSFKHPLTKKDMTFTAPLAVDMSDYTKNI